MEGDEESKKEEVEKKVLKLSITEKEKEGKSKMIVSCRFLEDDLRQSSKGGVTMADSVATLGVDLRTGVNRLGAKEKARRKCKVRFSLIKKNKAFRKNYMKGGQEVVTSGYGTSKNVEGACCGYDSYRKIKIGEADGSSSSRGEGVNFARFFLGSVRP